MARGATLHPVRFTGSPWPASKRRADTHETRRRRTTEARRARVHTQSQKKEERQRPMRGARAHGISDRNGSSAARSPLVLEEPSWAQRLLLGVCFLMSCQVTHLKTRGEKCDDGLNFFPHTPKLRARMNESVSVKSNRASASWKRRCARRTSSSEGLNIYTRGANNNIA